MSGLGTVSSSTLQQPTSSVHQLSNQPALVSTGAKESGTFILFMSGDLFSFWLLRKKILSIYNIYIVIYLFTYFELVSLSISLYGMKLRRVVWQGDCLWCNFFRKF